MSDEVNVFMDPFLKVYTNPEQIEVADSLTENFHKEIVLNVQRNTEQLEHLGIIQSKPTKTMEKQTEKPSSSIIILESKLNDVKKRERLREKKQSGKEKQAEKEVIHITNETTVDPLEKVGVCHFDMKQMEKCFEEQNDQIEESEQPLLKEKGQSVKEHQAEKQVMHKTNETTEGLSEKGEMYQYDMILDAQFPKEQNEQTEAVEPCEVTTEQQHLREKQQTVKERQAEKDVIHITKEATPGQLEKAEICHFDMIQDAQSFEGQNEQTQAEEQHMKAEDKEKQKAIKLSVPMINEEAKEMTECGTDTDMHKTKQPDSVETDHFHEPQAIMEKDFLIEKPNETNLSESLNNITIKEEKIEVLEMQKQELISGAVCPDVKNSQEDTDNMSLCKVKENMHLQSEDCILMDRMQTINTRPKNQDEHIYEVPDVVLTSSAEETECAEEKLMKLDNITLNIAVTGSTGAGKSSFINAIRGLAPDDDNAAPTGVTETTMTSTVYTHPTMPSVKFWDLPGTGSPKFRAKKYLKEVKLDTFDFFIIISSERFKENDIMLAKAIKEKKKLFYFLRSKIDNDIQAESQRKDFDEQKVLTDIREDCHRNLKHMDDPKPHVFLISSFEMHKYDFQTLVDTLKMQLPDHKKNALILSLPIYSSKILDEKIKIFMKQTWSAAVASGSIAVAPVPGLSIACDAAILLAFFTRCYNAFGLDDESIHKLSLRVNNPSLKSVRKSPLAVAIGQKKLSNKELSALTNREAAVKFAWSMVPFVGSKKTAEMSYSTTLNLLRAGVQDLADTAKEVLKVAGLTDVY